MNWSSETIVLVLLATLTLVACVTGPLRRAPKRELSFGLNNRSLLLGVAKSLAADVTLTYKNQIVSKLTGVTVSLMNTGRLDIVPSDFEGAARIVLSETHRIFSVEVVKSSPTHLAPSLSHSNNEVIIAPFLLNAGEFFTLRVVVENRGKVSATLQARVSGITAHPALNSGAHPGYEIGALLLWGGLGLCCVADWFWLLNVGSSPLNLSLLTITSIVPAAAFGYVLHEALQRMRMRWMGDETQDLRRGERI